MRQLFLLISFALLGFGLYLNLLYDVPDSQERINFYVSWFCIIIGISTILMNLLWGSSKKEELE